MKSHRPFLILTVSLLAACAASTPPTALPPPVAEPVVATGFAVDRLARIDGHVEQAVTQQQVAGAVALIMRHGELVYSNAWGMADIESGSPMVEDSLFRIASMTKPITSTAVMMLYEEGFFGLDEPVGKYLPAFNREMQVLVPTDDGHELVPAKNPITIRSLLTHSSGISYRFMSQPPMSDYFAELGINDGMAPEEISLAAAVNRLAELPLAHEPGAGWTYGLNTDVLGYLVEVVSGRPFEVFLEERLFQPLGMNDTVFKVTADAQSRLATVYRHADDGSLHAVDSDDMRQGSLQVSADFPLPGVPSYASGGGGLVSTAGDYARFAQMILNGGELDGVRVLSPKTVQLMQSDQLQRLDLQAFGGLGFGLGFSVDGGPAATGQIGSPGVIGWSGFFNTLFWIDPEEDMLAILMMQHFPYGTPLMTRFRTLVYQALEE